MYKLFIKEVNLGLLNSIIGNVIGSGTTNNGQLPNINKIDHVFNVSWDSTANFRINELTNSYLKGMAAFKGSDATKTNSMFAHTVTEKNATALDILNRHVTKITIPAYAQTPIEVWSGSRWRYTSGRPVVQQLVMTFTDFDNNVLYKEFAAGFRFLYNAYPKEQLWTIKISRLTDAAVGRDGSGLKPVKIDAATHMIEALYSKDAILESISELRYDQSNQDLVTFDVTFKILDRLV